MLFIKYNLGIRSNLGRGYEIINKIERIWDFVEVSGKYVVRVKLLNKMELKKRFYRINDKFKILY